MPTDNTSTLDNIINTADITNSLVNKFIVTPIANLGIAGLIFDIYEEQRVELQAEITDHFAEDNSAIQDHIAIRPDRITLRGYVGELVYDVTESHPFLQQVAEKLTIINSLIPELTTQGQQIQTNLVSAKTTTSDYIESTVGIGINLYQAFKTLNIPSTKQAQAFNFFRALFNAKQLVSLDTPWTFYNSMAIESLTAIQGPETNMVTDFSITLKKFNTASTQFVKFDVKQYQGRRQAQGAETVNQGNTTGVNQGSTSDILNPPAGTTQNSVQKSNRQFLYSLSTDKSEQN